MNEPNTERQEDREAALRLIAERPDAYPVLRYLPDDMKARLESKERLNRHGELARELIVAAMGTARAMVRELRAAPGNDAMCERIELALILNAITDAVKQLDKTRANVQTALAESTRRHEERDRQRWESADRFEASTGGRSLEEVLESERQLTHEVARLKCLLQGAGVRS